MPERKTKPTESSVEDFLNAIADDSLRQDCREIAGMMQSATKAEARMWGPSIVGFGTCLSRDSRGRESDWMLVGFSPRKLSISLYLTCGVEIDEQLLARLGKHRRGKSCLYIKRLSDVHRPTLEKLIRTSVRTTQRNNHR